MKTYTAKIPHTPDTIRQFATVQFDAFHRSLKIGLLAAAAVLAVAGVLLHETPALSLLCLFAGCLLFTNTNAYARFVSNKVIERFHGSFPTVAFSFTETGFTAGENTVSFRDLHKLLEDSDHLYLLSSSQYGYMIAKSSISGPDGWRGLRDMLQKKTGLSWTRPVTLNSLSLERLRTLFTGRRDTPPHL